MAAVTIKDVAKRGFIFSNILAYAGKGSGTLQGSIK